MLTDLDRILYETSALYRGITPRPWSTLSVDEQAYWTRLVIQTVLAHAPLF